MSEDKQHRFQRMQRIRVGLTGLSIVLLIVAVSTAIFQSAHHRRSDTVNGAATAPTAVTNMVQNEAQAPNEPLTELGVTPGTPANGTAPPAPAPTQ